MTSASNRTLAPSSPRRGDLSVQYDAAGNLTGLVVRRDGSCLPSSASCWQRFDYEWDAIGQLQRARRWDLSASPVNERVANDAFAEPLPARPPNAELRFDYDAGGQRVLKTAVDAAVQTRHTVYVTGSYELRSAAWTGTDYTLNADTATLILPAGPVSARVIYAQPDLPSVTAGHRHLLLELSDHMGSGSITIDHQTSELVELATYQAYGATESDYRPGRWGSFREPYKFTGKEEDIEFGLTYFGARYYSPYLGTWMSSDPVAIHELGGDPNPYAYVHGRPTMAVDPDGRDAWAWVIGVAAVLNPASALFALQGVVTQMVANGSTSFNRIEWGLKGVAGTVIVGHVVGAATAGIGSAIGGAVSPIISGAISGAVGSASGYGTSYAITGEGSWDGFFTSVGIGAGAGALGGGIGYGAQVASGSAVVGSLTSSAVGSATSGGLQAYAGGSFDGGMFALSVGSSVAQSAAVGAAQAMSSPAPPSFAELAGAHRQEVQALMREGQAAGLIGPNGVLDNPTATAQWQAAVAR